jgi:hypothetical protein
MFEFAGELEPLVNLIFLCVTAFIAVNGIRYKDEEGNSDFVRMLFGSIAAVFFSSSCSRMYSASCRLARALSATLKVCASAAGHLSLGREERADPPAT